MSNKENKKTPYSEVFELFLGLISDPDLALLTEGMLDEQMLTYLNLSIVKFTYPKVNIRDKNDDEMQFNVELSIDEKAILANLMVIEWVKTQIHNIDLMENPMTVSDFTSPNQGSMLRAINVAKDNAAKEAKQMIMAYERMSNTDFRESRFREIGGGKF